MSAAYNPPPQIRPDMQALVASVDINRGDAIQIDVATGGAALQDNSGNIDIDPAIGIAANSAKVGQIVFVQQMGTITVQTKNGPFTLGDIAGSQVGGISDPSMVDLGDPSVITLSPTNSFAAVGLVVAWDGVDQVTILVNPLFYSFISAPTPPTLPQFADDETPTTFNTNIDYDLAHTPNPLNSLQVFIDDTISGGNGCNKLMIRGNDYTLTTGSSGPNSRIHFTDSPLSVNTIRCWYRF